MISSIEWIPRGVADPNPKKYKLSKAEREFLEQVGENDIESTMNASLSKDIQDKDDIDTQSANGDEPFIDISEQVQRDKKIEKLIKALPTVDPSTLPEELRMDEYSDDDEDNDNNNLHGHRIGQILLGSLEHDENHENTEDLVDVKGNDSKDDDEDDDDSLQDVPDTREYMPTDIKGLEAMRFSGYNGMADYEDNMDEDSDLEDDSDVEDTNLRPDDALIIVAKTEEVCCVSFSLSEPLRVQTLTCNHTSLF